MATENYDNLIIGSGEGGKYLAWHLGRSGEKVAVVERRWIGGSCPNINCLPSKNEVWSAKVADMVHHAGEFGSTAGSGAVDMAVVRNRKREMVGRMVAVHVENYKKTGVDLILGHANFVGPNTVEIRLNAGGTRTITGKRVFLNVGTHASIPPVPGLAEAAPMTNIELLEIDRLPQHLVVIGAGYVGLEFAQAYRRFGSRVTIIEQGPQLLNTADADVTAEIVEIFKRDGIDVIASAAITNVEGTSGTGVKISINIDAKPGVIEASDILVATGRTPNTSEMGLDAAGVVLDARGYIKVNDRLETTAANVWAMGECAGSPQFTHVSYDDFRVIRDNLAGGNHSTNGRVIPSCLFTDPQLAHIGLTEREAQRRGIAVRLAKIPTAFVLRAQTTGETRGFLKALIDPKNDRILGFTMVGAEAGEVLSVVQMTMAAGLPFTALREAILTHPTMGEGLGVLFSGIQPASAVAETRTASVPHTSFDHVEADGVKVFYREAGPADAPVVLLLHGFPASSFQYRDLIPRLADRYRVIAPDLPGFGFTEVPAARNYRYTFDSLAQTILAFTDAKRLQRYALYVFDYGAPTGFRMALARPERVAAIVSQNGCAYEEGLGDAWAPIRRYWSHPTQENRDAIRAALNAEGVRREYSSGISNPKMIAPEDYTLDAALLARPGNVDIQLDLFLDYANNVKLYPAFQEYFRRSKPPLLAIWGKDDPYFVPAGAEAFRRDIPNAQVRFLDTGHFALETHLEEVAAAMRQFLENSAKFNQSATA
jgi:pyruvate/2-oxoglutarate dehydrogenase complex dihydrolipoamide dehydrogenase (E3) component/pimeloyl-ACP methyl ester carboxylesterase